MVLVYLKKNLTSFFFNIPQFIQFVNTEVTYRLAMLSVVLKWMEPPEM